MRRVSSYLRQNIIALLALTLVVGGGAAYAASTKLPKNSVASKQVKNNSLKGKDLKDGSVKGADLGDASVTGTDLQDGTVAGTDLQDGTVAGTDLQDGTVAGTDLQDGSVTGTDVQDGGVGAVDLAVDAADEVRVFHYNGGGTATVWEQPGLAKATFSLSCSPDFTISALAALDVSPGRVSSSGFEQLNQSSEPAGTPPLIGSSTVSRLNDVGQPVGAAVFGGSKFGYGTLVMFFQTPKLDVYIDLKISLCSAHGTISIDHKPQGSTITRPAPGQPNQVCEATGAAYCSEGRR